MHRIANTEAYVDVDRKCLENPKRMYILPDDKRALLLECGADAVMLLDYYISRANTPSYTFPDKDAAKALGYTKRKVAEIRRELIKHHWFYKFTDTQRDGNRITTSYVGRDRVRKRLDLPEPDIFRDLHISKEVMEELRQRFNIKDHIDLEKHGEALAVGRNMMLDRMRKDRKAQKAIADELEELNR